jgi:hypothetical protein
MWEEESKEEDKIWKRQALVKQHYYSEAGMPSSHKARKASF